MSKPRNPMYFPDMKVRGASRRSVAAFQRMTGVIRRAGEQGAAASSAMDFLSKQIARHVGENN